MGDGSCRAALLVALLAGGSAASCGTEAPPRPAAEKAASQPTQVRRSEVLGQSVRGRPITAVEIGDPASPRKVLIVGCIHGDEPAGIAIGDALATGAPPANADLWIVPSLNPDGVAAQTRTNGHGVDLNRNFPSGWQSLGPSGSSDYAGPAALSEPESRLAADLIRRVRPTVGIWFHQHMAVVDTSQGPKAIERQFARDVGLPEQALTDYPGSAVGWENTVVPDSAFVVELPAGSLSASALARYVAAIHAIAG